ncbi:uncharacterized protein BCR38DRAFT_502533 [Pseudomassariella vexata]|uniref:NADP-dependent oxidoreductase domain-containing protein n=1 Tax=Pseudomassariella vexata TaxID=1141098 RepID=A0A1Y2EEJ7_9PEZI|nr:uncharacterized protein BCR38DRAFT_502533 [Pseudomassariella vexata]ORY69696.1 hypothetical protein BCR38DRAFT_502533 [Pseudomassariella vexata]
MELVSKVEKLSEKKGCKMGQIAVGWVLAVAKRPGVPTIVPIPRSTNPNRIRENATILYLTNEELADIDRILEGFIPSGDRYPKVTTQDWEQLSIELQVIHVRIRVQASEVTVSEKITGKLVFFA